ncbi:MAG TPA: hypothetical protein VGK59_11685 [Ohtaekwangia sp.]
MNRVKEKTKSASKTPIEKENLPGEYPPSEDIMNPKNGVQRIDVDIEDLDNGAPKQEPIVNGTPVRSQLTREDLMALGYADLNNDQGDDELLKDRAMPVDFSGKDMDVPGSENDDSSEEIGAEDEENNAYSLDRQDNEL